MTDEEKLFYTFETFADGVESAFETFLDEAAPIIAKHPEWYETLDKDGDKVCAEGNKLGEMLDEQLPKLDYAIARIEGAGFEYFYMMERLASEVWKIVKRKQDEALLAIGGMNAQR